MKQLLFLTISLILAWIIPSEVSQAWIATAVGAGLGVLSSLYGGKKASQAARKANALLDKEEAKEKAWFDRRYNEDYADTAAGQNLIRTATDFAKSNWKKAEGSARVAGSSDSAAARAKEAGNKMIGNTIASLAANDTARKDSIDRAHRQRMQQIGASRIDVENNRAAQINNAASQASNSLITAGALLDSGSKKGFFQDLFDKDK